MEVEFFDSHEAAERRLRQAMRAADARVRPWQASLRVGDCFVSLAEDGLVVFGEVLETYSEWRLRHYRFCRCFSVACPEGELGDVHVSSLACVIRREEFEAARQNGWELGAAGGNPGAQPGRDCGRCARVAERGARGRRDQRPVLVVLCGPSHSGKSSLAAKHLKGWRTISSDGIRRRAGLERFVGYRVPSDSKTVRRRDRQTAGPPGRGSQ